MTVPGTKLSQIALAGSPPALSDTLVGVGGGTADKQYTLAQVQTAIAGSGSPGGPLHAVQVQNPLNNFDGDADFTWVTGSGLTSKRHAAFGNIGGIDDQGGLGGTTIPAVISIAQQVTKDLSGLPADGLACYSQWKHTGASPTSYIVGGDFESIIDATNVGPFLINIGASIVAQNDGTGTIQKMYGVYGNLYNFGNADITSEAAGLYYNLLSTDGHIVNARAMQLYWENDGATPFDNASTVYVFRPFGLALNCYGIYIEDQSGIGSTTSYNIFSAGTSFITPSSKVGGNLFQGHMAVGNYADVNLAQFAAGDPTQQSPVPGSVPLVLSDYISGDMDGLSPGAAKLYKGVKHTGVTPVLGTRFINTESVASINTDSTGEFDTVHALNGYGINFGSGAININMSGGVVAVDHVGSGTVELLRGGQFSANTYDWGIGAPGHVNTAIGGDFRVGIDTSASIGTLILIKVRGDDSVAPGSTIGNAYGILIDDMSAVGASGDNMNIKSVGASSLTKFEGHHYQGNYYETTEVTAPAAPPANGVRIYAQDNGAGKTQLMALFNTGAAQQIAIQP